MQIRIDNVRLAFPHLFEPHKVNEGDTAAYSAAFIFPKNHPQVVALRAAIEATAKEKWGAKAEATLKTLAASDRICLHDGDTKAATQGYEGNFFVNARNQAKPSVFNGARQPLTAESGVIYGGCYVNVLLDIYAQDNKYGKRVNANLKGVQFLRDGDAFAGGGAAKEDDFDALEVDSGVF